MIGQRFGRLVVKSFSERKDGRDWYHCQCNCGQTPQIQGKKLKNGHTQSCGCLRRELSAVRCVNRATHRLTKTETYKCWSGLKQRCTNPKATGYAQYGARGISVCERWVNSFENFLVDMGERPAGTTLDRIDVNGNYAQDNCRWASLKVQNFNKRNTRLIEFQGIRKPLAEWAEEKGLAYSCLYERLKKKWPIDRALTEPQRGSA